jgi:predicted secreted protein
MAKYNGDKMLVVVNGVPIGATRSFTLTVNRSNIETTTKDSNGSVERIAGTTDWNVSFDGLLDPSSTFSAEEVFDMLYSATNAYLEMAVIEGGGLVFRGDALANNLTITAPQGDAISVSGGFDADGPLAKGTVVTS